MATTKVPDQAQATGTGTATSQAGRNGSEQAASASGAAGAPFPAAWLVCQETDLRRERDTYLRQADRLQAEAESLVADFEPGDVQFDEDGGEGDTLSSERERDLAISAQAREAIAEIDHALAKFATGIYGICEVSGEPIPTERLEAIPWARVQIRYKVGGLGTR